MANEEKKKVVEGRLKTQTVPGSKSGVFSAKAVDTPTPSRVRSRQVEEKPAVEEPKEEKVGYVHVGQVEMPEAELTTSVSEKDEVEYPSDKVHPDMQRSGDHTFTDRSDVNHRVTWIQLFAEQFKTAEFAFVISLLGVIGQSFHIYRVVDLISDFSGAAQIANSLLWASFFSFGVMFFTLKLGKVSGPELKKKFTKTLNWLITFEIAVNLYYWVYKLVIFPGFAKQTEYLDANGYIDWMLVDWTTFNVHTVEWPKLFIVIILAVAIPLNQKAYAGEIYFKSKK